MLSDEQQRAIYDTMGVKGLETEGWEVNNDSYQILYNNLYCKKFSIFGILISDCVWNKILNKLCMF